MHTIRKTSGLAGTQRDESAHDAFGAGHSSTSISAALGMAVGATSLGKKNHVISVIGDGAMTAGQAYEAMNNSGSAPSSAKPGRPPRPSSKQIGGSTHEVAAKVDEYARGMISASGSSLFEELGLYYIGPVDVAQPGGPCHNLRKGQVHAGSGAGARPHRDGEGEGYPAEEAADKMHGVVKFDPRDRKQFKTKSPTLSYTYFAESLIREAEVDDSGGGDPRGYGRRHGSQLLQKRFPGAVLRRWHRGAARRNVRRGARYGRAGKPPWCHLPSFLQRGYDQVVHDVDPPEAAGPLRPGYGLVGVDGPTHCGAFDVTHMACLPTMVVSGARRRG
ncbi:hypothetical protein QYE76_054751 [Lolium multiflorum]|uniref:Uncharacterized protein n=1 Tax=Lolium multiflorum TaxID=4521 RepID=A0AAD8WL59_LOLMU|nr:hypothetical protein QYE76_054751 [Lolium multiflorum]